MAAIEALFNGICALGVIAAGACTLFVGVVSGLFILGQIFEAIKREMADNREGEERARLATEALNRNRRNAEAWAQSPAGRAFREKQLADAAERERIQAEQRFNEAVERGRRRREQEEQLARLAWQRHFESKTMLEIDSMSGLEFEDFLSRLLPKLGYTNVALTPVNDQGGDIVCRSQDGAPVVVQAKRWKSTLGNVSFR